nr:hypothetical protein [Tanacetum cinerariifolium]
MHVIQNVLSEEKIKDLSLKNEQCVAKIARLDYLNRRCAAKKRDLRIQQKNHLLQYDDLIAADLAKEVGLIMLASEKVMSPSSNCRCEELKSTCNKEHSRVLDLEAEVLEKQQLLAKSEQHNSIIEKQFVDLQVKIQNYKEGVHNQKVCETPNATASNALFEINKLKAQLQARDDVIRHLQADKDILSLLTVGPTDSSLDTKALETENAQ